MRLPAAADCPVPKSRSGTSSSLHVKEASLGDGLAASLVAEDAPFLRIYVEDEVATLRSARSIADLRVEVNIMRQLTHPHITRFMGAWLRPLRLAYQRGQLGTLAGTLSLTGKAELPLGWNLSRQILVQIASALEYLHGRGLVYGPVSAQRVEVLSLLLDDPVNVCLSESGLVEWIRGVEPSRELLSEYHAPEMCRLSRMRHATWQGDVFSFAMLAYQLLTGVLPMAELASPHAVAEALGHRKRPSSATLEIAGVPPVMQETINACWAHDPATRPRAALVRQWLSTPECEYLRNIMPMPPGLSIECAAPVHSNPSQAWICNGSHQAGQVRVSQHPNAQ